MLGATAYEDDYLEAGNLHRVSTLNYASDVYENDLDEYEYVYDNEGVRRLKKSKGNARLPITRRYQLPSTKSTKAPSNKNSKRAKIRARRVLEDFEEGQQVYRW